MKLYSFSKANLFQDYIDHFYNKKKMSIGAERFIAKLHLNTLYGTFGRKLDNLQTIIGTPQDAFLISTKHIVRHEIKVNKNTFIYLVHANINFDIINKLNLKFNLDLDKEKPRFPVKANVAVASAVTAMLE